VVLELPLSICQASLLKDAHLAQQVEAMNWPFRLALRHLDSLKAQAKPTGHMTAKSTFDILWVLCSPSPGISHLGRRES